MDIIIVIVATMVLGTIALISTLVEDAFSTKEERKKAEEESVICALCDSVKENFDIKEGDSTCEAITKIVTTSFLGGEKND